MKKSIQRYVKKAPEPVECVRRSVAITGDQRDFLNDGKLNGTGEELNLSQITRDAIEELRAKRKAK